jgi:hypothetical protein
MNYQHHSRLIKWAVAAVAMLVPIACSSTSTPNTLNGPSDSGTKTSQQGGQDSGASTNSPMDSGTTTSQQAMDSSVSPTDSGTTSNDSSMPPPGDGGGGGFAGAYACTLSGAAMVAGMSVTLPLDAELTATESGTAITALVVGEGGISCTLDFTDQGGGVANINAGQTCVVPVTTPVMTTATLTFVSAPGNDAGPPGKVTLSGGTIATDLPFDVSALGGLATGTGVLTGNCIKM